MSIKLIAFSVAASLCLAAAPANVSAAPLSAPLPAPAATLGAESGVTLAHGRHHRWHRRHVRPGFTLHFSVKGPRRHCRVKRISVYKPHLGRVVFTHRRVCRHRR